MDTYLANFWIILKLVIRSIPVFRGCINVNIFPQLQMRSFDKHAWFAWRLSSAVSLDVMWRIDRIQGTFPLQRYKAFISWRCFLKACTIHVQVHSVETHAYSSTNTLLSGAHEPLFGVCELLGYRDNRSFSDFGPEKKACVRESEEAHLCQMPARLLLQTCLFLQATRIAVGFGFVL